MKIVKKAISLITLTILFPLASQANVDSLANKSWDEVVSQAKDEGEINFNVWYLQPRWRDFVKEFENEYGIKVNIAEGTIDAQFNKLLSEKNDKIGKIDVIALATSRFPIVQKNEAIARLNWIPEYSDKVNFIEGFDTGEYAVAFWGNQTGIAYDPDRISEESLPQTFDELNSWIKNNPYMFGYNDPNNGGAGNAFIQRATVLTSGEFDFSSTTVDPKVVTNWSKTWQWFVDNKENIVLTGSGADSITRLNDGEFILVPAWEDHLAGLQKAGAITPRLKFYVPEFGMLGGGNIIAMPANAKNSAAAAVFINWLTSEATQKKLNTEFGTVPMIKNQLDPNNQVLGFSAEYGAELKKQFVTKVMMK
ncbi:extracellular solute-binding protein [Thorsellia kenyensis]|uniref:Extracellular solute-binding protein n=1 Tax=Thorsellia kenyensis TaxID=1549888 RepID=A0ABV6C990_9GAMM